MYYVNYAKKLTLHSLEKYHQHILLPKTVTSLPPTTTKQNFKPLPVPGIKTRDTCHRSQTDFVCAFNTGIYWTVTRYKCGKLIG